MPYKIVKTFEKGHSKLSAVPSNWEKDGVLHWPKYNENKLRREENSCPEHHWRKINCKVKRYNLNNFTKAEEELDAMCRKSDTDTDTNTRSTKINYVTNQMTFEEIVQDCINYDNISPGASTEVQIGNTVFVNDTNTQQNDVVTAEVQIGNTVFVNDSNSQQNNVVTTEVQIDNASLTLMVLEKIETLQENYKNLNEKISESIKAQQDDRRFINESVQSVLLSLSNIGAQFERVMNQFKHAENNKQKPIIQTIANENDLNNFEKELENPEVGEEWKKTFSTVCGKGKGRGVNNAYALVDAMFSRSFLLQCSWAGGSRTSEQKICFKSHTKIINFFFDIIHDSDSSYTLLDCHEFFKNILKNARQRNESKQQRTSRTKNRPKIKAMRKNLCNGKQSSLPITETSEVSLPVGTSGSENDDPMSSASVARIPTEPLETSV